MSLNKEQKTKMIQDFRLNADDTGSVEVQIALLTERINQLTGHLNIYKKDFSCKYGLLKMIGRRRKLLRYLSNENESNYKDLLKRLELKK